MEAQPLFSLGIRVKKENPSERRKKRIQKQIKLNTIFLGPIQKKINISKKKNKTKTKKRVITQQPEWFEKYFKEIIDQKIFLTYPHYNLFYTLFPKEEQIILSSCIPSVEQQQWILETWSKSPFGKAEDWTGSDFWSLEKFEKIKQAIFKTNKYRGIFRRFLNRWRLSRFQKVNDEDLFTCEVPKYPIQIVDWSSKSIWVFEGQSLMRDITNRLLHHDGCFEDPLAPRNPYTNLPLTASQTISVWSQLMRSSASFPFTAYRASRMNLSHFRYEHRIYLAIHALRKTFEDITFYETKEKMLDFIEMAFDRQDMDVNTDEYEFVLNRFPKTEQLQKWKHLCEKYYEFEIKYADFDTAREKAHDKVFTQTLPLLHQQEEIKKIVRENRRQPTVRVIPFTDLLVENPFLLNMMPQSNTNVQEFMQQLLSSL
jgi:hypothetical protein